MRFLISSFWKDQLILICCLLITFANSLDLDQDRQKCRSWSVSKLFDTLIVFLRELFLKVNFPKKLNKQKHKKLPRMQRSKVSLALQPEACVNTYRWVGFLVLRLTCKIMKFLIMSYWINSGSRSIFKSFTASGDSSLLLITFTNSLDQNQASFRLNIRPDLDPNCLTLCWNSWMRYWKCYKIRSQKKLANYQACKCFNSFHPSSDFMGESSKFPKF